MNTSELKRKCPSDADMEQDEVDLDGELDVVSVDPVEALLEELCGLLKELLNDLRPRLSKLPTTTLPISEPQEMPPPSTSLPLRRAVPAVSVSEAKLKSSPTA